MATIYVKFTSSSDKVISSDCTTRWNDSIKCSIPMSKIYGDKYTNLMIMTGDPEEINDWITENSDKVVELTEAEINAIGKDMVPEGTTNVIIEEDGGKLYEKTYTAGEFTITGGQEWTLTNNVDITP